MADETTTKRKRSLEEEMRDAPAGPSSPNAAFDEAMKRTAAAEKLRADVKSMPKLPASRTSSAPPARKAEPTTHGSAPRAPAAAMAKADAALGKGNVVRAADDLQQAARNDPSAFRRPGLTPNLAPATGDIPDPVYRPFDPDLLAKVQAARTNVLRSNGNIGVGMGDMYVNPESGIPRQVTNAGIVHGLAQRRWLAGADQAAGNDPKALDLNAVPDALIANRARYLEDRDATQALRHAAVTSRGIGRGLERFMAMNPRAASAMGMGGGDGGGAATSQQFDPVQSAMFGAWLGGMTGHPGLAADFARGAGEFNARAAENAASQRESALNRGLQNDQLAELKRHNIANEGITGTEARTRSDQQMLDLISNHPYLRIAGTLPAGSDQQRKAMQAYHMAVAPIVAALTARGINASPASAPGAATVPANATETSSPTVVPVGWPNPPTDLFGSDAEADLKAGKLTAAAYAEMRKLHPVNLFGGWNDNWVTEAAYKRALLNHYRTLLPGVDENALQKLVNQYYYQFFNGAGDAAAASAGAR